MNHTHNEGAYPFLVERGKVDNAYAYDAITVCSQDGWIEYWLTQGGWWYRKEASDGGVLGEDPRTVFEAVRDTELAEVIKITADALDAGWFPEDERDALRDQIRQAQRVSPAEGG
jgi:hypothetical protein